MKKIDEKKEIRKILLEKRNLMDKKTVEKNTDLIIKNLKKYVENAKNIMIFMDMGNEVNITKLLELYPTKTFFIPKIFPKREMKINKYNKNELVLHKFGYYESSSKEYYDEKILDLIVVPGIGFDCKKNRIGFGGGFYDNFLTKVRKMKKGILCVAVCYDFQIVEKIPTEEHDVRVDAVVSEKRVIV
ncbi:MAG: 5-formyltetrahydrofolate cyclo-ligase [Leptotrichia sp.]|nr:MAG: 5-formyltetrahydrofolate cyclo-ligase [Leptotrichia sp.]